MTEERFREISDQYQRLRIAVIGDYCLDRYLEIDPSLAETSLETGLAVYNVTNIRSQSGGAGTIVNNLAALGGGEIFVIGFCGADGEGYELKNALQALPGVDLDRFVEASGLRTFTYTKPLICEPGAPPRELNRLDFKNWKPTPAMLEGAFIESLRVLASKVDAIIALDQVDTPETGVMTKSVRQALGEVSAQNPRTPILADSRRGLRDWPKLIYKMNARELAAFSGSNEKPEDQARQLAQANGFPVFVTLAEQGMLGASSGGEVFHQPCFPIRGEIDIVGAGDAVTANLTAALAAGARLPEALELASAAASVVIHQIGTTGTANISQLHQVVAGPIQAS
jgi:rfaE bifunctional protein kinase chain/domain